MRRRHSDSSLSDLALGHLTPEQALATLTLVERDEKLSKELDDLIALARVVEEGGEELFAAPSLSSSPVHRKSIPAAIGDFFGIDRRRPTTPVIVAVILICLLGLPGLSELTSSEFDEVSVVHVSDLDTQVRGEDNEDIQKAQEALEAGRIDEGIWTLRWYVRANAGVRSTEFAEYLLGGAYLARARRSILGLFPSYDTSAAREGVEILGIVVQNSRAPRLSQEARFLRAKGLLMLGKREAAIDELAAVIVLGGPRQFEAMDLLERISSTKNEGE